MADPESRDRVRITVAYSPRARETVEVELELPSGATVGDALRAGDLCSLWPEATASASAGLAVWGRRARLDQCLQDHDRVELCRPLIVDPKVARRERFQRQGSRGTGLFARRRPGSKPGY
jgi:putative ubiquitin-RnfH superfamily antitoxin RatB of RatAB toxin-antitoxin module